MTLHLGLIIVAAMAIAFANGANDNFKGVATLFGAGTASYRTALLWATVTTMAGSLMGLVLAGSLVARFSGAGLVPEALTADPVFLTAVAGGAAATVLLATIAGFPVSTTHALTGALVGAGALAAEVRLSALGAGFVVPLLLSPVAAAGIVAAVYGSAVLPRAWRDPADAVCICMVRAATDARAAALAGATSDAGLAGGPMPIVASMRECTVHGLTPAASSGALVDAAHYLSAGAVGFARGVNDTPKLLALLLPAHSVLPASATVPLVALVMAIGGVLGARRVAQTLSHRVTTMTPGQGFLANAATAVLVLLASRLGLPVSTTHVSTGSLVGLGAVTGGARWATILQIVLAWVVTLPCAAASGALLWWLL